MKRQSFFLSLIFVAIAFLASSCTPDPITIDSSLPNGTFTAQKSGTLIAESSTPTTGTVELGTDEDNVNFLRFADNFVTELATGTVSVYFSTSDTFTADPGSGNPDLQQVGAISSNGEQFVKLSGAVDSKFTHVILWCNTAGVPFGNAPLQ